MASFAFEAIGTRWRIDYWPECSGTGEVWVAIADVIEKFDRSFSRFRADSWVSRARQAAGTYGLPEDAYDLLTLYEVAYRVSGHRVTPLIGLTMEQAGYDAAYSLVPGELTDVPAFDRAVNFMRTSLTVTAPVLFDFGAAGKGYLIDKVGGVLRGFGIDHFVIDGGGDMLHAGPTESGVTVGLENPYDLSQAVGTVELANGSLCASAGSRRAWGRYTHVIDSLTLASPTGIAAAWTKAPTAAAADMAATCLFFAPPARVGEAFGAEYAVLDPSMRLTASAGFGARTFEGSAP